MEALVTVKRDALDQLIAAYVAAYQGSTEGVREACYIALGLPVPAVPS